MSIIKKVIAGVVVVALIAGAVAGGAVYIKKSNEVEVLVVSVDSVASDYYMQDTYLDGNVTTNVSQNVTADEDMIIKEVAVSKGDSVQKGDLLVTFDMTLVEMELNIAKLKKQQQEQELNAAVSRLQSLQNGGPILDEDSNYSSSMDDYSSTETDDYSSTDMDDEASAAVRSGGAYLAAAVRPVMLAAAFGDVFSDEASDMEQQEEADSYDNSMEEEFPEDLDQSWDEETTESEFSSGSGFVSGEIDPPVSTPTPTPVQNEDVEYFDDSPSDGQEPFHDGNPVFYSKLDGDSIPYTGRGSEEEPYVFLCSAATGKVAVTGEFLNKMAGFSEDGSKVLSQTGYWYQIEFHNQDTITNFEDRTESCIGYYLICGTLLESPVNSLVEMDFTVEGADTYDQEEIPEDDYGDDIPDDNTSLITRAEAIKQKQSLIADLKLDIQESEINIAKLEKKVAKQVVYSKIDGIVSYVGDTLTGSASGDTLLTIKSKDGYYVKGTVSELLLDDMQEGTIINCDSYGNGSFEAEVVDVADYPESSGGYYYGDGNPNVSYYTFSAVVTDQSIQLSEDDWLSITLASQSSSEGSIVLGKEFVRSENGVSYVYKDDNGVLKKQILQVGGNVNSGYSVLVKGGLTREDKIAFPYGKSVQEGVKTREGTLEELYGY